MTPDTHREILGAVSIAATCELLVIISIFIAAAIGCNVGALTSAVSNWMG